MALEIERKFLVRGDGWRSDDRTLMRQGYLSLNPARTVRVRVTEHAAMLTIKGPTVSATRAEFEYPVPRADGEAMLALCEGSLVEKTRTRVRVGEHTWEVDEFLGDNAPLIVAEIELMSEDEDFLKPSWVGEEVTDDPRYFNASLVQLPYSGWCP